MEIKIQNAEFLNLNLEITSIANVCENEDLSTSFNFKSIDSP